MMIHLISAGGFLHIYREYVYTAAGESEVEKAIIRNEGLAKETASADFAAQIVSMYAEMLKFKAGEAEGLDAYHANRLAELEKMLSSYGISVRTADAAV